MMTQTQSDPRADLKPNERHVQLEMDVFCIECAYNLHGQPVTRDPTLGIFVCRCPECGKYHPAGTGISAVTPWLRRVATILLIFWILIILTAVFLICLGSGAMMVNHIESFSYRIPMTRGGQRLEWKQITAPGGGTSYQVVKPGTTQPVMNWTWAFTLERPNQDENYPFANSYPNEDARRIERVVMAIGSA